MSDFFAEILLREGTGLQAGCEEPPLSSVDMPKKLDANSMLPDQLVHKLRMRDKTVLIVIQAATLRILMSHEHERVRSGFLGANSIES